MSKAMVIAEKLQLGPDGFPVTWPKWVRDLMTTMEAASKPADKWDPLQGPPWVESICNKLLKVGIPAMEKATWREPGPRIAGRLVGHEITIAKELPKQSERMTGAVKQLFAILEKSIPPERKKWFKNVARAGIKETGQFLKAGEVVAKKKAAIVARTMRIVAQRPNAEAKEFFKGMTEAHERPAYREDGGLTAANSTYVVYMWLVMNWKAVETFQSVPELHKCIVKWLGSPPVPDVDDFGRLCRRHGLRLAKRGRPQKKRTLPPS